MIPDRSEASLKDGNWIIYNDGINTIQIWGSYFTGKERIYLNNELVSELRSMKMQSEHRFTDKNNRIYSVRFETQSLLKGRLKCTLQCDENILRTFKAAYIKGKTFTLKRFLIVIVALIFGVLKSIYDFPDFIFYLFLATLVTINFIYGNNGEMKIEEE